MNFCYQFNLGFTVKEIIFNYFFSFVVIMKLNDKHILMYVIYKIPLSLLFTYFVLLSLFCFVIIILFVLII